jgi:hypothetical protein
VGAWGGAPHHRIGTHIVRGESVIFLYVALFLLGGAALFCWYWIWPLFYKGFIGGLAVPFA